MDRHAKSVNGLTPRQLEVGQLIASGYQTKEIAERLGIHPRTVQRHIYELYCRLGVASRGELVGLLLVRGLCDAGAVAETLERRVALRIEAG